MALGVRFTRCPDCESADIRELFRIEANEIPGYGEDTAVYRCDECGLEWDATMRPASALNS